MTEQQEAQKAADEAREAYEEALKQMIDRHAYDQVLRYHSHAMTSKEHVQAMLDDYERLLAEKAPKG
jgi:uncharacterized protein (UPF0335 family)